MALLQPNLNPTRGELRRFGALYLPLFLVAVAGLVFWRTGALRVSLGLGIAALATSGVGLLAPRGARLIYLGWMYAVYPIGWTISHAVMAATFYLVVAPIGLVMSLGRRDPLRRQRDTQAESYWSPCEPDDDVRHYVRQF
jgi:hypothetical protein